MKILIFGATGMIGEGVLRWLMDSPAVDSITAVTRRPLKISHRKIEEVLEPDMFHLQNISALQGFDACLFCLGVSSVGMKEREYRYRTRDLAVAIGRQLLPGNPRMVFEFVSGAGAGPDARQMWRRVKGEAEDAVLDIAFHDAYALRPGYIQPMRGAASRDRFARLVYGLTAPIYPYLQRRFDKKITSTDLLAQAMLRLAVEGSPQKRLSSAELNSLARQESNDEKRISVTQRS